MAVLFINPELIHSATDRVCKDSLAVNCDTHGLFVGDGQAVLEKYLEMYDSVIELTKRYRDLLVSDMGRVSQLVGEIVTADAQMMV